MRPGKVVGDESVAKFLRLSMGTFIEARGFARWCVSRISFPFLSGRAFIEVFLLHSTGWVFLRSLAETFIEALRSVILGVLTALSLPFGKGFH